MSAQIIPFRASRRRALIEEAARMLNETHGEAANEAWKRMMRDMAQDLIAKGVPVGEMREQVLEFQAAVQLELMAQSSAGFGQTS
jgi:hypothetical protein